MRMNEQTATQERDAYLVKKSRKSSVIAFIVCVVVAFLIWSYAEAVTLKEAKDNASPSEQENSQTVESANE